MPAPSVVQIKSAEMEETPGSDAAAVAPPPVVLTKSIVKRKELKFVHITKNAGTTIEEIGRPHWGRYDKEYRDAVSDVYGLPWDHWHIPPQFMARDYLSAFRKKFDFFAVVRNPFDRVVSEYYCEWGGPKQKQDNADHVNRWICGRLEKLRRDIATFEENRRSGARLSAYPVLEGHWIPQHLYLWDTQGARIIPPENLVAFEDMARQFDALMRRCVQTLTLTLTLTLTRLA